jgi:hypothetical protein
MPPAEVTSPWKEASSEGMDSHHNPPTHKSITGLNGKYRHIIVIIGKTALFSHSLADALQILSLRPDSSQSGAEVRA